MNTINNMKYNQTRIMFTTSLFLLAVYVYLSYISQNHDDIPENLEEDSELELLNDYSDLHKYENRAYFKLNENKQNGNLQLVKGVDLKKDEENDRPKIDKDEAIDSRRDFNDKTLHTNKDGKLVDNHGKDVNIADNGMKQHDNDPHLNNADQPPSNSDKSLSAKERIKSVDAKTQNCIKLPYNPYTISGISVQAFRPKLKVWDQSCIPLKFSRTMKFPKTALASHPGSGSTWSRHLIQQLTGVYIGSVYGDLLISDHQPTNFKQFSNLVYNGSCIAIKTHEGWGGTSAYTSKYDKVILIIRNPHNSMLAEFKRQHWNVGKNRLSHSDLFADDHFAKFFPSQAASWLNFHQRWLNTDQCVLVVQYEHLHSDLHFQLMRIAHYLGIDVDSLNARHIQCILDNTGSNLKWPTAIPQASLFTAVMNATLESYKEQIRELMHSKHGIIDIGF